MSEPRVAPLTPDQLNDEQAAFLQPFTNKRGEYPNIFGTLVRHMDLAKAWSTFGLYTLNGNQLDPVQREVLILRTAILIGSEYEWHQHKKIALRLGMDETTIEQIRAGTSDDPEHLLLIQCADELLEAYRLSDDTWQAMQDRIMRRVMPKNMTDFFTLNESDLAVISVEPNKRLMA